MKFIHAHGCFVQSSERPLIVTRHIRQDGAVFFLGRSPITFFSDFSDWKLKAGTILILFLRLASRRSIRRMANSRLTVE